MRTPWPTRFLLAFLSASMGMLVSSARAESDTWPQWRGADGSGVTHAKNLPVTWTEADVVWKCPLPGRSSATPVLWKDRLFVPSPDGEDLYLLAISTEGRELWRRKLGTGNRNLGFNSKNNLATPSPMTDGKHVWVVVGTGDIHCFDFEGNTVWNRNLVDDHGPITQDFGLGSSPLLHKDRILFPCIHRRRESYLLAIDKATGKDLWKTFRQTEAEDESRDAYSSPAIVEMEDGRTEIILAAADVVTGHDFETGEELWRHGGLNPTANKFWRIIVTPVYTNGLIYVAACKQGPFFAIRPGGKGDVTNSHREWIRPRNNPDVASPVAYDGLLFLVRENGFVLCLDAKTGEEIWGDRVAEGYFASSPLVGDGHLYVTNEKGEVFVLNASREMKVLAKNALNDYILASPVPADDRLYFRCEHNLVAIGSAK